MSGKDIKRAVSRYHQRRGWKLGDEINEEKP